jgi:hypothetical protein
MAQRNRYNPRRDKRRPLTPQNSLLRQRPEAIDVAPAVQYGPPMVVMEDENKNTFLYEGGAWVPHERTIAEFRQDCLVKEMPQKVKRMTRYEVRCPLA